MAAYSGSLNTSLAFAQSTEDISLQGTILKINDDGSFDLETADGIETILTDDTTIIDDGLALSDLLGLVVDVDVVDTDGVLFATEIEFDSAQNDAGDEADVDEDISLQGTILTVNDDGSFDLETADGIQTILTDDNTIIDDGLELSALVDFEVDIDAIETDAGLLATEIEFEDETEEEDDTKPDKVTLCHKNRNTITISENAVDAHLTHGDELGSCDKNETRYDDDEDYDEDESKKTKQEKLAEKLDKTQEKLDKKQAKAEEKRAEKLAKHEAKLLKAETRLAEKISELEEKLTEKAHLSEERANKILEKIAKETDKTDDRVQKLIDKFQSGKYFGENKNTDKEIKSFTLSFEGTAVEIGDKSTTESLSGEIYLENLLTGSHSKKFRVTGGSISIAEGTDNAEVFDVIFGKARLSSSGQGGEKDSMILIAQTSNGVDIRTLKLSINLSEEFDSETESVDIEILSPRSKIASEWFLGGLGSMGLTESLESNTTDDTPTDDTPDVIIPDEDIPIITTITVLTPTDVYFLGNEIEISGTVTDVYEDTPVILQTVTATDMIDIAQLEVAEDGTFSHTILADGPLWVTDSYTVKAFYGANNFAETTFEFLTE